MDSYGVVLVGSWLISIPGLVIYLLATFGLIYWTRLYVWWVEVLILVTFNVVWQILGLSFFVSIS
jgi:hypothetical protein